MKTIPWILIALLAGGTAIAEEAKPRNERTERPISAALIKEFDKDGDGKLSDQERAEMRRVLRERREARQKELLRRFDADGDGKLSDEERKTALETIRKEMLAKYDANGNGRLDPEERAAMIEGEGHNPLTPFMRGRGQGPEGGPRRGTDDQREGRQRLERGERRPAGEGRQRPERRQRPQAPAE